MTLAYHEIVPEASRYLYTASFAQLDEHLRVISELTAGVRPRIEAPEITFDDGHISNYSYGLPVLEKNARRAIFFVTVSWTGVRKSCMDWAQLRELVSLGHQVQSHTWSHAILTRCTAAEAEQELRRSKQTLEDKLGVAADALSVPHGRWNERVLDLCARVGYRRVYTSDPWMRPGVRNGLELRGRLMIWNTTGVRELEHVLTLGTMARTVRRAQAGAKELAQHLLGDRLYLRLWCLIAGWEDPEAVETP
jgi:peptidoglycan/xylan/chitin deacetylase (PgdA/CDA1 family)